jgi:hypothetical protein
MIYLIPLTAMLYIFNVIINPKYSFVLYRLDGDVREICQGIKVQKNFQINR